MRLLHTIIKEMSGDWLLITMGFGDADEVETSRESIVLTVEIETVNDTPYLKEVQREALDRALHILEKERGARKTVPRPAS